MSAPKNAGQTITVQDVIRAPKDDVDLGEITITENWGRLFIKKGNAQIVISQNAYRPLVEAIAHFTDADLCDPTQDERVKRLVEAAKAVDRYCHWFREGDELRAALRALEQG